MNWILPVTIGLVGSLHCVTMCGPLVMIMGIGGKNAKGVLNSLLYHFSRIMVYFVLGLIVGATMQGVNLFGVSQIVSIVFGGVFFAIGLFYMVKPLHVGGMNRWVQSSFSKVLNGKEGIGKFIFAGALNGLLPCGLVYVALSGATLTDSLMEGGMHMLFFGLGTLPSMLGFSVLSNWVKSKMKTFKTKYIISIAYCVFGVLLIVRGMGIGVPYLSPKMDVHQQEVHCCHKK